ncbi:TetR/AcrR family transcriptional regulator [Kibdelosporangium philippinense]|uniref:TetR/AcrR family transcriptional regulator n=1 Tax=Kibdelosporangium philippinense TaxID=211113 RepID=A0ABS8ZCS4_9PSEU|nr:TetR family transcriptional regulator [Kibdelosporangium philippinense]MCE7004481.1 TetR/AcrR family transcriptional regulator [Kibdelosporangium philippinense]
MTEGEQPLGLRERKKLETRAKLVKAAIRLATAKGIEHVTVDDIAAEAGVSARTFFNYFPSKEDAVLRPDADPIAETQKIIDNLLEAPAELSPVKAYAHAMRHITARLDAEREDWLVRISIIERDPSLVVKMFTAREETERMVLEALGRRCALDPDTELYPTLVFMIVAGAFRAAVKRWISLGGSALLTELFDTAIDTVVAGMPVPTGTAGTQEGKK